MHEERALTVMLGIAEDDNETTEDRISAAGWVLGHFDSRLDREYAKHVTDAEQSRPKCCGNLGCKS